MRLNSGSRGVKLMVLVGYCGEFPVALLDRLDGYYDYNRRVLTELVREGYLKERRMKAEQRHVVRSVSLTQKGLSILRKVSPRHAVQIAAHTLAPASGQGNWPKTQRLHREAACLLMAMGVGAVWNPAVQKEDSKKLVYYSTYEFNQKYGISDDEEETEDDDGTRKKKTGKDSKGSRASGIFVTQNLYYLVYYLGNRNMRWYQASENHLKRNIEFSPVGQGRSFRGYLFIGEDWTVVENLVINGFRKFSQTIRILDIDSNFVTLDGDGILLMKAILNNQLRTRLYRAMYQSGYDMIHDAMYCLFPLDCIAQVHEPEHARHWRPGLWKAHFFSCQIDVVNKLNNKNSTLIEVPDQILQQTLSCADVNAFRAADFKA